MLPPQNQNIVQELIAQSQCMLDFLTLQHPISSKGLSC